MKTIGDRLAAARLKTGMTQLDLAKKTGLQPTAISHFETGNRRPSVANLVRLCREMKISADFILGLTKA